MKNSSYIESEDMYEMGLAWIDLKEYEKAEECIERAVSLNPGLIYAYIDLAALSALKENFHRAIQILKKGTRIDPGFHRLHFLMAEYAGRAEDYRTALTYIDRALELERSDEYLGFREELEKKFRSRRR
jgi:tetratricopeptide (TPR) repeat protein